MHLTDRMRMFPSFTKNWNNKQCLELAYLEWSDSCSPWRNNTQRETVCLLLCRSSGLQWIWYPEIDTEIVFSCLVYKKSESLWTFLSIWGVELYILNNVFFFFFFTVGSGILQYCSTWVVLFSHILCLLFPWLQLWLHF